MSPQPVRYARMRALGAFVAAAALVGGAALPGAAIENDAQRSAGVKRTITVKAPGEATAGRPFSVTGRVSKTPRGKTVVLQVNSSSGWKPLRKVKTRARGRYAFKVRARAGSRTYRVVAPRTRVGKKRLAVARSRAVTVNVAAPPLQYVDYEIGDWTPYGGSGNPAFVRETDDDTGGSYYQARVGVGQSPWVSFNLKGQCLSANLTVSQSDGNYFYGTGFANTTIVIKADGAVVSTQALGPGARRAVELSALTGVSQLEVSATATGESDEYAWANFWGTLNCVSGTSS